MGVEDQLLSFTDITMTRIRLQRCDLFNKNEVRTRRAMSCYPEMEYTTSLNRFPFREITTMTQERRRARDIPNNQFVVANRTGDSRFHTTWSINEKGDRVWLAFDPSRPCIYSKNLSKSI